MRYRGRYHIEEDKKDKKGDPAHPRESEWAGENPIVVVVRFLALSYYTGMVLSAALALISFLCLYVFSKDFRDHNNTLLWVVCIFVMPFLWPILAIFLIIALGFYLYYGLCNLF